MEDGLKKSSCSLSTGSSSSSNDSDCQLTAITEISELHQLRDLYRSRQWPLHCAGYYCLDNFIHWFEREPEMKNIHIYTLDNDWRRYDGLFLIVDRYQLFMFSLNDGDSNGHNNNELLAKALSLLDWKSGYKVSSFLERHRAAVLQVVQTKQLRVEYDSLTVMYYMCCKDALKLEINCPQGYHVRPMSAADDAQVIDDLWPNRHQGSLFLVRRLIAWNVNMGVYDSKTNELVAWCLRLQGGFLGALQVKDTHKRLGLGSLVARATSRRIAEMGHDVMALVNKTNKPSRSMFDKLGFTVVDTCYWLRTFPIEEGLEWLDGE